MLKAERMAALIDDFRALRSAQRGRRLRAMGDFLSTLEAARAQRPATFNTFALLDVADDEMTHSRFLAWLLDGRADHRQGNLFMKAFIKACGLDIPNSVLDRYRVRTEFSGTESLVDVMAYGVGEFIIYIENKIEAEEAPEQLAREFRDMRRASNGLSVREERQYAVFLTPDGRGPISARDTEWVTLSYTDLANEFRSVLPQVADDRLRFVVEDWIENVTSWRV